MMDALNDAITTDVVNLLYRVRIEQKEIDDEKKAAEQQVQATSTNKEEGPSMSGPRTRPHKKIYPNDPCPCGSGKKYKNCHGRPGAGPLPGM